MPRLSRFVRLLFTLAALAVFARAGAPPSQTLYTDPDARVTVVLTPAAERWTGEGFLPVRVRLENAVDASRAWTLSFETYTDYNETTVFSVPLLAGPGESFETFVFVPGNTRPRDGQAAWVTAKLEGPGAEGSGTQIVNRAGNDPFVVTAVSAARETELFAATNGAPGPRAETSVFDPALWPADWRVWSPFQRVVLTEAELLRLDGARRAALRDWVALGGVLDLYPTAEAGVGGGAGEERHGFGAIRRAGRTLGDEATSRVGYRTFTARLASADEATLTDERRKELEPSTGRLGLSLFLIVFGLLVGPINLFVFAPAHRRQRLFITVPALSLAASLLMGVYIVMKDGLGGEGTRRGQVLLLPDSNQAVLVQHQVARTGVLFGTGFGVPEDALLQQVDRGGSLFGMPMRPAARYLRDPDEAGGDWFTSRRMQEQTLRQLVPTRARVELVGGGQGDAPPVVQSSVGATLRDFVYRDATGRLWEAAELPPGVRVPLRARAQAGSLNVPAGLFAALGGAAEGLAPLPTLTSIRWDEDVFLYTGPLSGARTP